MSVIMNEALIEVAKSQEGLYTPESSRLFPITNCFNLLRVNFHTIGAYHKPKIFHMGDIELALLDISLQPSFTEL